MIRLLASLASLKATGRNLFRPMTTTPLPWKGDRPHPERYRTSFALVHDEHGDEACIGCKMCEKICPSQIISVTTGAKRPSERTGKARGWADDFILDVNACIHCELCVQVCPTDAIVMLKVQETPGFTREDLLLTMDRLYANERIAHSWGTGTLLVGMQEAGQPKPAPRPPPAAPAAPKPDAAAAPADAAPKPDAAAAPADAAPKPPEAG